MFKSLASVILVALSIVLPTAAQAQIDSFQTTEATSDILGAGRTAQEIRHLRQVPSVGVFNISFGAASPFSQAGDDVSKLEIFAEKNAVGVNLLRRALVANPVTRRTMAQHGVNVNRVLGVSIGDTGSLRFFID